MVGMRPSYSAMGMANGNGARTGLSSGVLSAEAIRHHLYGKYLFSSQSEGALPDVPATVRSR